MATPLLPEKNTDPLDDRSPLPGTPRSGELSPYAQKVACEAFVWLCSIVVFGSTADFATSSDVCSSLCTASIVWGVISFVFISMMLLAHVVQYKGKSEALTWYTSKSERDSMIALALWWTFGVSILSSVEKLDAGGSMFHTSWIAIVFGWLAFFGSIYGSYKAHHAREEEKLTLRYQESYAAQAAEDEEYANFS